MAAVLDSALSNNIDLYADMRDEIQGLFPEVKSLKLPLVKDGVKELQVELNSGVVVPARNLSAGFLYYMLFSTLSLLSRKSVLLVEEPENGLHPARVAEVIKILRKISQTTQVLVTTHSPLVINELQPEEVTLITRPQGRGTMATSMKKTAHFEERAKVFALGELWLSHADGNAEKALIEGVP